MEIILECYPPVKAHGDVNTPSQNKDIREAACKLMVYIIEFNRRHIKAAFHIQTYNKKSIYTQILLLIIIKYTAAPGKRDRTQTIKWK